MALERGSTHEKVSLYIGARALPKVGALSSKPSSFAVLYAKDLKSDKFVKFSRTDPVKDNCDPDWIFGITFDYLFEVVQEILVKIYDKEGRNSLDDESKHTFLGECQFFLASLMCSKGQKMELRLTAGKNTGAVLIRGEAQSNVEDIFCVTFSACNLLNKEGFFSKSDPFLVISRMNEDNTYTQVWKNQKVDNNLNPAWAPARIPMTQLCNGDIERPLRIEIFDFEKSGHHHPMGQVDTSVKRIVQNTGVVEMVIEPEMVKSKKGYVNSGTLTATNVLIESRPIESQPIKSNAIEPLVPIDPKPIDPRHIDSKPIEPQTIEPQPIERQPIELHPPSFAQFIQGGCEISLIVAVDFTASNGHQSEPTSLHYISPEGTYNPYQQAIISVGNVLQPYDTDNMYPVYGFGAKVKLPNGKYSDVQHSFPVYGGGLEVKGVDGILKAYRDGMERVMLSGPTLFAPLLRAAVEIARSANCSQTRQKYTVLLIITDGEINDMTDTKAALVQAAQQPLSVIIAGVGSANFASMKQLDNLNPVLPNGTKRNLVEFVALNEMASLGPSVLSAKLLAQIPSQFLKFMADKGIKPNPKRE